MLDNQAVTFPKLLQQAGYETAIYGKWHLGEGPKYCPAGFDDWAVVPNQGFYFNPVFHFKGPDGGTPETVKGYVTDIIYDMGIDFIEKRDQDKPFCVMLQGKAPHRSWFPKECHQTLYVDEEIPEPETLYDDYSNRGPNAAKATMRVGRDMIPLDLKCQINMDLPENDLRKWAYQRYIKDYLRTIASVDENVGRLLDYLDEKGLAENTIVIYTSDHGFFLGEHGWYDKRFMYEESLRVPFIARYPKGFKAGTVNDDIAVNIDFAPTLLDLAGVERPEAMQGESFRHILEGEDNPEWRDAMYYRYYMQGADHDVNAHYGIRTETHKLIYFYNDGEGHPGSHAGTYPPYWELYDLEKDPNELNNVYDDPAYSDTVADLKKRLAALQEQYGDRPYEAAS